MHRRITKYSNRRLYDAVQKRAITLLELSDLLADGESVTVEHKETGEDITTVTLLQSLLERLKREAGTGTRSEVAERVLAALRGATGA
jgi:polyhydroxyalkanoate synthesis regulator protein